MWRTTDDINDTYQRMLNIAYGQVGLGKYTSPGHWNDPDMLEVGNGGMNTEEYRTHMSLWAVLGLRCWRGMTWRRRSRYRPRWRRSL